MKSIKKFSAMTATMRSISTVSMLMVTTMLTSLIQSMYLVMVVEVTVRNVSVTGL